MKEQNFYDVVLDEMHKTRELMNEEIHRRFGNVNPFRMTPVPEKDVMWIYENMASEDMNYARQKYGDQKVGEWIAEMEQMRRENNA